MRAKRSNLILISAILFLFPALAVAEEVQFRAAVNKTKLGLEETLLLSLNFAGAQDVSAPELPAIDGFNLLYGPSIASQTQIVNGVVSTSRTFEYGLSPTKEGTFTIPTIEAQYKGKVFRSAPIKIEVVKGAPAPPEGTAEKEGSERAPTAQQIAERLFIETSVDKQDVVVNEQVVLTFRFYRSLAVDDLNYEPPVTKGFLEENLGKQMNYRKVVNGIEYEVIELKKALFPVSAGTLEIPPAKLKCSLLLRSPSKRGRAENPFDGFFDDSFNSSFFGDSFFGSRYVKRPMELNSKPIALRVAPLPQEGRPASFADAVGEFDLKVEAKPQVVAVGDPVTLTMKVVGSGNLQSIKAPTITGNLIHFKTYEPESKTNILDRENGISGEKLFEKVLIPNDETVKEIPAIEFSYYDPATKGYQTKRAGPFPLNVLPATQQAKPVQLIQATGEGKKEIAVLDKDVFYIKPSLGWVKKQGDRYFRHLSFYAIFWGPLAFYFFLWLWQRRRMRLVNDPRFARSTQAVKRAREILKQASSAKEEKEVCALVEKSLTAYLGDKLGCPPASVLVDEVSRELREKGFDGEHLKQLQNLFQTCDLGRFAASAALPQGASRLIDEAKNWINTTEKIWKQNG